MQINEMREIFMELIEYNVIRFTCPWKFYVIFFVDIHGYWWRNIIAFVTACEGLGTND